MKVVLTGASGFVGEGLASALLGASRTLPIERLTLVDRTFVQPSADPRVRIVAGDIADPHVVAEALHEKPDCLFHLAALPGGAAEADRALGWRLNLDATRALFESLQATSPGARVVFTSSIAVFGVPTPPVITDDTTPVPTLSYGAQKLMMETWLTDASRRGLLDARVVRLPGIMARPEAPTGHISAFLSNVFHKLARGEPFEFPVAPHATTWMMSRSCCVENLIHAARLDRDVLPLQRAWTLPALRVSMSEIVDGLARRFGAAATNVSYAPNEAIEAQFGRQPPLVAAIAQALGFRQDPDVDTLIARVLAPI